MDKTVILEVRDVVKIYPDGQVRALNGVSLQVFAGEFLVIRGPSGCGKSTLMHLLGGLDIPTEGEVLFRGIPLKEASKGKDFRVRNIGFIFQGFYLWQNLDVFDNVMLPLVELEMSREERLARVREAVKAVGLSDKLKSAIANLSMGQRQRVAVARALVTGPSVILADEPTGSLDSVNADNVLHLFRQINREQSRTIVMVTHGQMPPEYYDRQLTMLDGKVCG